MTNSSPPATAPSPYQSLSLHLKQLQLSHMLTHWEALEHQAMQENWSYAQFLLALCEFEQQVEAAEATDVRQGWLRATR